MTTYKSRWTAFGGFLLVLALAAGAKADFSRQTYLTFNRAVRLPGVALGSGTFVFEVVNSESGADVVLVTSPDRKINYFLGLTTRIVRPKGVAKDAPVSFGEAAPDSAPPITAWWPIGQATGYAFNYR